MLSPQLGTHFGGLLWERSGGSGGGCADGGVGILGPADPILAAVCSVWFTVVGLGKLFWLLLSEYY